MSLHLHFEPTSGIAGDMAVAALVDAGVPSTVVSRAVAAMGVRGLRVAFGRRIRGAYVGRSFDVSWPGQPRAGRPQAEHEHDHEHGHEHEDADEPGHAHAKGHGPADGKRHGHGGAHAKGHGPADGKRHGHGGAHAKGHGPADGKRHDHDDAHAKGHGFADGNRHDHPHTHAGDKRHGLGPGRGRPARHDHRDYAEIKRLLKRARFSSEVRALAADIFARLAEVEAALHGTKVDRVTFHEVGAYDSIADVVGVAAAIAHLAPDSIGSLPPVVGTGTVRTAHGPVPVPAPATAALLTDVPIVPEGQGELTTPTGAAILAAVVDRFGAPPPMRLQSTGYGAGTRELRDRANVLRVMVGEPIGEPALEPASHVVLLEANVDDMNPQLVGPLFDALFTAGAVDVWSAAILMKKGRPALQISALAPEPARVAVERALFQGSTTLGLRRRALERVVLARSFATVETPYGAVRAKVSALDGAVLGAQPEFEDCRRLAARTGVPAREVLSAAAAAARRLLPKPAGRRR